MVFFPLPLLVLWTLPCSNDAATPTIQQSEFAYIDILNDSPLPTDLKWEDVRLADSIHGSLTNHVYRITCNARFGVGIDPRESFEALSFAPRGYRQETWLQADTPAPPGVHIDVTLPVIVLGNSTKVAITAGMNPPQRIAHASAFNVSEAARAVIQHCVISRRIGGIANNIGGDNKLLVAVQNTHNKYQATCDAPIEASSRQCQYILDEMPKSLKQEVFGRPLPGFFEPLDVALPFPLRSPAGACQYVIDSVRSVSSSWAKIWIAAEILAAACIRAGKGGQVSALATIPTLGREIPVPYLRVRVMEEPRHVSLPPGEAALTTDA
ncbi:MAG: hypothetical protein Q9213_003714 [Squamulea squamosa]